MHRVLIEGKVAQMGQILEQYVGARLWVVEDSAHLGRRERLAHATQQFENLEYPARRFDRHVAYPRSFRSSCAARKFTCVDDECKPVKVGLRFDDDWHYRYRL